MDSKTTHTTTPAKSSRVPLKKTSINAKAMHTNRPSTKVGSASAKLGPMRSPISCPMSRPPSEKPKSKRNSGTERAKKIVSVNRTEEHTSELQSLMRNSYAVFCLKKKKK